MCRVSARFLSPPARPRCWYGPFTYAETTYTDDDVAISPHGWLGRERLSAADPWVGRAKIDSSTERGSTTTVVGPPGPSPPPQFSLSPHLVAGALSVPPRVESHERSPRHRHSCIRTCCARSEPARRSSSQSQIDAAQRRGSRPGQPRSANDAGRRLPLMVVSAPCRSRRGESRTRRCCAEAAVQFLLLLIGVVNVPNTAADSSPAGA